MRLNTGATVNGTAAETTDWPRLKDEIVSKLDVAAEFRRLGVEFSKPSADAKGRRECHAFGRKDDVPSAFVNVRTGIYHDSGGEGESLHLFDFAMRHGRHGRWIDVVKHYAAQAGVEFGRFRGGKGGNVREALYLYREADGRVRYGVFRYRTPAGKKTFSQHPPDGKGGWVYGPGCMDGVGPLPYRLPELLGSGPENDPVWICEGEKDCDRLAAAGFTTTTNHGGCNATDQTWPRFLEHFAGRECYVVPDNDPGGRAHANKVAAYLKPIAKLVKVVPLPGSPKKGDVSDWLDMGHDPDELGKLAWAAPEWEAGRAAEDEKVEAHADEAEAWGEPVLDVSLPAEPFPLDALPLGLADFVSAGAAALGVAPDYLGLACLVIAAGAAGRSTAVALKEGWTEVPSLYGAIVGDPGTTKSPALGLAGRPLWKITEDLLRWHKVGAERARQADEDPPPLPRLVVDDTTVEALAPILQDNPRGLIMLRDELTAWVSGLNQYKGGKGADRQFFLSAWSGSAVVVDRKSNGGMPLHIPRPFLCVLGGLTPAMLSELAEGKNRDDGFLDRLLYVMPDPVRLRWGAAGVCPELAAHWEHLVRRLNGRHLVQNAEGKLRPFVARLTHDAVGVFGAWFDRHCAETEAGDFPPHLRGPWAKFRAYCARLSLLSQLLHDVSDPDWEAAPFEVTADAVRRGVELVEYFKGQTRRVRGLLRGAGADNDDARAILHWARSTGRRAFSERDARRNFPQRFKADNKALHAALAWLEHRRCVRQRLEPETHGRGRPSSPSYDLNPGLFFEDDGGLD